MRPRNRDNFAIAIICALPLEAEAVEALFDETYDRLGKYYRKERGDANAYINGRIGKHDVVLCYLPGMGKGSAASVASSLLVSYPGVKLALVIGICGGAPPPPEYQEIFLGDVIISDSVIEYDFGRQYPGEFQRKTGVKDTLGRPGREIRALLNGLRAENARRELQDQAQQYLRALQQTGTKWCHPGVDDILFKACYLHKHYSDASAGCSCFGSDSPDQICEEALGKDCNELDCNQGQRVRCQEVSDAIRTSIYIGPVASADTVMKSGQNRDEIVKREKVIGFEMEGAGVWDNVPCIIIKGVCDYADSHKSKVWRAYAAATGASAAKAFLEYWLPANHNDTSRNRQLMIPFAKNSHFVGRQEELQKLEDLITMPDGPRKLAVTGLGGVGKTQIALELAYRIRDREPECSIFWIPCTNYEAVEQAYMNIAQMVGLHDVEPAEVKERVQSYFSQTDEKWILIFDNADEIDMWLKGKPAAPPLKNIIPRSENGHILFTSRNRQLALKLAAANVVSVPDVDPKTGKEIFKKLLMRMDLLQDDHVTTALLEQLSFLPLAISQAAAYINQNDISLARYMSLLGEQEASTIELLGEEFEDDGRYAEIQNPVATTWLVSFTQIHRVNQLASDYLSFMACINPRDIPESILPATTSAKRKVEALGLLKAYSFVSAQVNASIFSLHRLVHLATRNWLRNNKIFGHWVQKVTDRMQEVFPDSHHTNRGLWREYLPHALALVHDNAFIAQQGQHINIIQNIAHCLASDGRYFESEVLYNTLLEMDQRKHGTEHPDTLTSMANLASTFLNQGRWNEAEKLFMQVMETTKTVLGAEHPDALTSMANLASTYRKQGRWNEAEKLEVQVMETSKTVLGAEHPDTLTSMANLASTYRKQGRWNEAEKLEVQVMETRKTVLGAEHPDTLTSMANLAYTWKSQGRVLEALALLKESCRLRHKVLGPDHPSTRDTVDTLDDWQGEHDLILNERLPPPSPQLEQSEPLQQVLPQHTTAAILTQSHRVGHISLPQTQGRLALAFLSVDHPLIIASRAPSPTSRGQATQEEID